MLKKKINFETINLLQKAKFKQKFTLKQWKIMN